jgi:hypothetical protein
MSVRDPGGRAGHVMRGRPTGLAAAPPSRTSSGHAGCPAHRPAAPILVRARPVAPTPARVPACPRARPAARTPAPVPARAVGRVPGRTRARVPGRTRARVPGRTRARVPVRTRARVPVRTAGRPAVRMSGRPAARIPARALARTPARALARTPARALARTPAPVAVRATVTPRRAGTCGIPASKHSAVTARLGLPSALAIPILGRRRTAAAAAVAVAGLDRGPNLGRTPRTAARNRPAAGCGS